MYTFEPSDVCLLRDFVYPLVRHEPNLFPHPFVHKLHNKSDFPIYIDLIEGIFQASDQKKHYFVMLEGPPVGIENMRSYLGEKTYWRKSDEWDISESGYAYGGATMYTYINNESPSGWYMTIYHVDPQEVLKCGPVELGLHQVELQWKAVKISAIWVHFHPFIRAPLSILPPPLSASSGMYAFAPSDICLLRDFLYPLVRHERNLFPHPFVHQLHSQSELPLDIDEVRRRFQILDRRFCDKYYFVMPEEPPTGEKNAIEIGGTKMFWKKIQETWTIFKRGYEYGDFTMYRYILGERETDWYMAVYHANLLRVRTCGPVELGLNQVESFWVAIKIFSNDASMSVFNPVSLPGPAPPGIESPPPPLPPLSPTASTGNKRNYHHPPAPSGNRRNKRNCYCPRA
ncbi:uncharacterized protein LOC132167999 [Corylus avellana]|uniref:uncharacterized protein LOC132167999 n=1 Tax=Corylus avellana TaxID=13451 RepID=UPI00286AD2AF|nr:uncharacterized protein LOC132167999 [Corylus avellana]